LKKGEPSPKPAANGGEAHREFLCHLLRRVPQKVLLDDESLWGRKKFKTGPEVDAKFLREIRMVLGGLIGQRFHVPPPPKSTKRLLAIPQNDPSHPTRELLVGLTRIKPEAG
jgi:hypothetical protein